MSFLKIIYLALVLFLVFPWFVTSLAPEKSKLLVFVCAIFIPFFAWVILYLAINGLLIMTHQAPIYESMLSFWLALYVILQGMFLFGMRQVKVL